MWPFKRKPKPPGIAVRTTFGTTSSAWVQVTRAEGWEMRKGGDWLYLGNLALGVELAIEDGRAIGILGIDFKEAPAP